MKKLDNKGFTLVELIAVIVLLSLITSIGVTSMNAVILRSKEENYELLVENIRNSVETYYHECKYNLNDLNRGFCGSGTPYVSPKTTLTLGELVVGGFITSNSVGVRDLKLYNPIDNVDISNCKINYSYNNGKITITKVSSSNSSCPDGY